MHGVQNKARIQRSAFFVCDTNAFKNSIDGNIFIFVNLQESFNWMYINSAVIPESVERG